MLHNDYIASSIPRLLNLSRNFLRGNAAYGLRNWTTWTSPKHLDITSLTLTAPYPTENIMWNCHNYCVKSWDVLGEIFHPPKAYNWLNLESQWMLALSQKGFTCRVCKLSHSQVLRFHHNIDLLSSFFLSLKWAFVHNFFHQDITGKEWDDAFARWRNDYRLFSSVSQMMRLFSARRVLLNK